MQREGLHATETDADAHRGRRGRVIQPSSTPPRPAPTAGPGLQPQAGPSVSIPGPEGQAGLERLVDVC